jgi:hypothetical protein
MLDKSLAVDSQDVLHAVIVGLGDGTEGGAVASAGGAGGEHGQRAAGRFHVVHHAPAQNFVLRVMFQLVAVEEYTHNDENKQG